MPHDKSGKFHLNTQRALAADKANSATDAKAPEPAKSMEQASASDEPHHKIYDHGDGTYHTESPDGERVDHANSDDLKGHIDSLFGHGSDEETQNDKNDNPDHEADDDPMSYRTLSGL